MKEIKIKTEFIRLDQALKFSGATSSGSLAKEEILSGNVLVNGESCLMRGKKLRSGDIFSFEQNEYKIV